MSDTFTDRNQIVRVQGSLTAGAGDIPIGSLAAGLAGQVIGGTVPAYAYPPGFEVAYDQITSPVNIASTSEGSPTAIIAGSSKTYEAAAYIFEFFSPEVVLPSTTGGTATLLLLEDAASIGRLATLQNDVTGGQSGIPVCLRFRFTVAAGAHTFGVSAFASATTGTPLVQAGAGGSGVINPAYIRATKV